MAISEEQVRHVAMLARLGLSDEQIAQLAHELSDILVQVEKIQALELDGVEPTTHAAAVANVTRADQLRPCLPRDEALRNAPAQQDGAFLIPRFGGGGGDE